MKIPCEHNFETHSAQFSFHISNENPS